MAPVHIIHLLLRQYRLVCFVYSRVRAAIYFISRDLVCHDSSSRPIFISRMFPHGLCQYVFLSPNTSADMSSLTKLTAIINMMVFVGKSWGNGFIYLTWAFWWVDAVVSMATCISMPFIVMKRHRPDLQNITAALLLPIVPTVVAAASAGIVAEVLPDVRHALTTLVAGYVLWGIGIAFSGCVLALYLQRLMIHSLPAREVIVSVFLPIGPLGQGGFGIQQLGKVALKVIPEANAFPALGADVSRAGEVLYVLGIFNGLVMWGFALVWLAFALISIITTQSFPFNMGWWGFTFPLGVLATCTSLLAENLQSQFFQVATMVSKIT